VLGIQPQVVVTRVSLPTPLTIGSRQVTQAVVGTDQRDSVTGSNAGEALAGGKGADQLTGGGGADAFIFETPGEFGKQNIDTITDFDPKEGDKLAIATDAFAGVTRIQFQSATGKRDVRLASKGKSNFVYDDKAGMLYFDANGKKNGWGDGGEFARLLGAPEIGKGDLVLV